VVEVETIAGAVDAVVLLLAPAQPATATATATAAAAALVHRRPLTCPSLIR
jgi:hypothetical protein